MTNDNYIKTAPEPGRLRKRLQKYGFMGLIFFSLKGLAWLLVPFLVARGCG